MRRLLWFKQDLRLDDNPALLLAAQAQAMLPVFVFDPRQLQVGELGARRLGVHRTRFLLESLVALDVALRQKGSRLLLVPGRAEDVIPDLVARFKLHEVVTSAELAPEEQAQLARVRDGLGRVPLLETPGNDMFRTEALPYTTATQPGTYAAFCRAHAAHLSVFEPEPAPAALPPLPQHSDEAFTPLPTLSQMGLGESQQMPGAAFPFAGGEMAAEARLRDYFWTSAEVREYGTGEQRMGAEHGAKLSPWLANGCLSARRVAAELRRHEAHYGATAATQAFWKALLWREFFRSTLARRGKALFASAGTAATARAPAEVDERFLHWCAGRTGMPLVDACMRELAATGFISNQARRILAGYLIGELKQDWRHGAAWFEEHLLDHEPASNWGNWAYLAGLCSDPQSADSFNSLRQARLLDPDAHYVSHWLPELEPLPVALRHTPFLLAASQREALGYAQLRDIPPTWTPYLASAVA
jgi:deoxyribodipyrimidine photo-lyase